MNAEEHSRIELSAFQSDGSLRGFVVSGRWPATTREWAQVLAMTVRIASLPGLLPTSTVFGVKEELPDDPAPGTVGLVVAEGPVLGERAVQPGIPHLGLEHRAAWVEAEPDGTVTALVSKVGVDPGNDPDTAILAMLLAS